MLPVIVFCPKKRALKATSVSSFQFVVVLALCCQLNTNRTKTLRFKIKNNGILKNRESYTRKYSH